MPWSKLLLPDIDYINSTSQSHFNNSMRRLFSIKILLGILEKGIINNLKTKPKKDAWFIQTWPKYK